jgi:hypothetical protein
VREDAAYALSGASDDDDAVLHAQEGIKVEGR